MLKSSLIIRQIQTDKMTKIDDTSRTEIISAKELFKKNNRFDLIIKYLYVKAREENLNTDVYEQLYKAHIKAFNNFKDNHKACYEDFINSFHKTIDSIKNNGFDETISTIRVNQNYECFDGSHRVAIAAYFDLPVTIVKYDHTESYDYNFFRHRELNQFYSDIAALEYCKFDKDIFIVNIQPKINISDDSAIEGIIRKYGQIFYKKNVFINKNGHLHLKLISYGTQFKEGWIGDYSNNFSGAKNHVQLTTGKNPLRAYIVKGMERGNALKLKREIRDCFNIGNAPVHINDSYEEALELAQTYFNENSLHFINNSPIKENKLFMEQFNYFKSWLADNRLNPDEFCIDGSSPMTVYGVRKGKDLDFLHYRESLPDLERNDVSKHNKELKNYTLSKDDIIFNPQNHFYHKGIKSISLEVLLKMKKKRAEFPKDYNDIILINYTLKPSIQLFAKIMLVHFPDHWRVFKRKPFKYIECALRGRLKRIM